MLSKIVNRLMAVTDNRELPAHVRAAAFFVIVMGCMFIALGFIACVAAAALGVLALGSIHWALAVIAIMLIVYAFIWWLIVGAL